MSLITQRTALFVIIHIVMQNNTVAELLCGIVDDKEVQAVVLADVHICAAVALLHDSKRRTLSFADKPAVYSLRICI